MLLTLNTFLLIAAGFVAGVLLTSLLTRQLSEKQRAVSDVTISRLSEELENQGNRLHQRETELGALNRDKASLEARLEGERTRYEEQLQLLRQARESLVQEFENLANRIFDAKQQKFSEQSSRTLNSSIDPLRKEIHDFRKKVEDAYDKENAERNKLVGQIVELQKQAQKVGEDAVLLANALKGESKFQGNWGEVILERILEQSGLTKGREYETQVALKNEEGDRRNPDVIIHLPDQRDIVVDAKVSLTDYERYCRAELPDEKQRFLKQHILSMRAHINGLSRKAYEQLEGVNSLDFVLIFVPVEAAFMLALEHDHTLFRDAYDKGIILVSPSTLLATLRTIHNIWRYEDQNRNAQQIAAEAGKLYDQLVLVVESLDDLGRHIDRSQEAWQQTRKRLVDGRGNLIKKFEDIKKLGARTKRSLPDNLVEEATEQDDASLRTSLHQQE
ncbi:DNA recombination protein RmuC [Porticoccus hydrocarbonoclasticus]|jgi:DNA recombination protein RmuC|uniref:DNA recombination protein RmuC n=1 Tax=Porticoccus hydrocarbonoclasticus TaxID=1073414 RepID=UPI00068CA451|nr:DNA recombination protein RmuC [Porticoccus hydrocarbonoclasticus]|tara:strand:- start:11167 stop:12504 length:1338 start_codon:yes stop_codon:yes gene_type:complete